jgi:hypothetical protein
MLGKGQNKEVSERRGSHLGLGKDRIGSDSDLGHLAAGVIGKAEAEKNDYGRCCRAD